MDEANHPYRKALIQICEPCNETCKHCFVSATKRGAYMPLDAVRGQLIPQLAAARANRVTLTGGEPFMHADLIQIIGEFRAAGTCMSRVPMRTGSRTTRR
ncbi:radical SAM protein [Streptomyces sp. NPDC005151]